MHQAVAAREDVDERTELGDVDHLALVHRPDLSGGRIHDQHDLARGLLDLGDVRRGDRHDADHPVVVDADVGAGLGLNGVDHLSLGADDLADLLDRDLEALDLGGVLADLWPRLGDGSGHDLEDRQTGLLGLVQGSRQHVGGDSVDLGVELKRRHELGRAGHLEVHVTEGILGAEDVGQRHVLALVVHEAHGDAGHRRLDRHTGVHHRQRRRADRTHRGRTVRRQHLGDEAQRVGELLEARHDREQGTLGERTMADLSALRTTHEAGLARRERREVVVVHEALAGDRVDAVDHLVHASGSQGGEVQYLGLATLEQARTVGGRDDPDIRRNGPEVCSPTTVDAHAVGKDPLTDGGLGDRPDGALDLLFGAVDVGKLRRQLLDQGGLDCGLGIATLGLVGNGLALGDALTACGVDSGEDLVAVVGRHRVGHLLRCADQGHQLVLELDDLADVLLGELEAVGQHGLVDLGCSGLVDVPRGGGTTGLDHHHGDVAVVVDAPGHDHLERRVGALLVGRVGDPLACGGPGDPRCTDRTVERNARQLQCDRGGVERQHVVGVLHVGAHDGADDVDLVAVPVREHRPQRAVDEAAGEDRRLGRTALTTEERTGDLARGVHALFDVDREREEVRSRTWRLGAGGRHEDGGVAELCKHGTAGQTGEATGLEGDGLVGPAEGMRDTLGVIHGCFSLSCFEPRRSLPRGGSMTTDGKCRPASSIRLSVVP